MSRGGVHGTAGRRGREVDVSDERDASVLQGVGRDEVSLPGPPRVFLARCGSVSRRGAEARRLEERVALLLLAPSCVAVRACSRLFDLFVVAPRGCDGNGCGFSLIYQNLCGSASLREACFRVLTDCARASRESCQASEWMDRDVA